jgi:hypothetical protein
MCTQQSGIKTTCICVAFTDFNILTQQLHLATSIVDWCATITQYRVLSENAVQS